MKKILGIFIATVFMAHFALADDPDAQVKIDLSANLYRFAKEHSLTQNALDKIIFEETFASDGFVKGGLGIIASDVYIDVFNKRNALILPKKEKAPEGRVLLPTGEKWEGKDASEPEIAIISDGGVVTSLQGVDMSKIILVIFSPDYVQYIDFANSAGGRYKRNRDK